MGKHGQPGNWPNAPVQYHKPFSVIQLLEDRLTDPLHLRCGRRIFVDSMSDLFHAEVPNDFLIKVWAIMALTPRHTFQILTKRPERMLEWVCQVDQTAIKVAGAQFLEQLPKRVAERHRAELPRIWSWPLPNVWLGTSVGHQAAADLRLPLLLQTPAAIRFVSGEPLLGPVDMSPFILPRNQGSENLNWVIVGGESGSHARPMELTWMTDIISVCQTAQIPVFVKQLGSAWASANHPHTPQGQFDVHGGEITNWPPELRIRQFPVSARN